MLIWFYSLTWHNLGLWYLYYYIVGGQIIRNYYRHIGFSSQSRFETKITLVINHMFILLKHDDKILNLVLYLENEPLT